MRLLGSWPASSSDLNPIENLWANIVNKWDGLCGNNQEMQIKYIYVLENLGTLQNQKHL